MLVKKIDIHVHSCLRKGTPRFDGDFSDYTTPGELRRMYDELGIEKGVQLPEIGVECGCHYISNEESYELVRQHPETYDWFCNIDPRWGTNSERTNFSYLINYYKNLGAKGVGELCSNLYFDDPRVMNLFHHCELCDMPVIFHIGSPGLGDYGLIDDLHLPRLEKMLKTFPKLKFLGHSQKFWAEISGDITEEMRDDYPSGKVTPGGRVVELMRQYPNLCGDLSAGSGENAIRRDEEFGYAFLEEFQDRLYFGTDICAPHNQMGLSHYLDDAVMGGHISQTTYEKICRENALKLLHRD